MAGPHKRGATIAFAAPLYVGEVSDVVGLPTCHLKAMPPGRTGQLPAPTDSVLAQLTVTPMTAAGGLPAGWIVTLSAAQSLALDEGSYVLDIRAVTISGVYVSQPLGFILQESVTLS